jgi:hypothetical protein
LLQETGSYDMLFDCIATRLKDIGTPEAENAIKQMKELRDLC